MTLHQPGDKVIIMNTETGTEDKFKPPTEGNRVVASVIPANVVQVEVFPEYLGVFFAILGSIFLLVGVQGLRGTLSFRRRAQQTEGLVTDVRSRSSSTSRNTNIVFYPVLQFTTRDGHQVQTETRTGRSPAPARKGDRVTVQYDPEDPASADIAGSWSGLLLYGIFSGLGALFIVIGLAVQFAISAF